MLKPKAKSALRSYYEARLIDSELHYDVAQEKAVLVLEDFADQLEGYNPEKRTLWSRIRHPGKDLPVTSGLYLYGDVGRGKSMLMDLFYSVVNVKKKRRVHFHQFMLEIHERLHQLQTSHADKVLPSLAQELAEETWLLCFDEFHVTNIVDAMILGRLFSALFDAGVIILSTSNWAPDNLYKDGLQHERFLPFIELIKEKMTVYCLDGEVDHRYEQLRGLQSYFCPLGDAATRKLQGLFLQLTDEAKPEMLVLHVQSRALKIVHAAKGIGFFNFDELCLTALGAADYIAVAECLHTVFLDGVPKFNAESRNEALRFMTLIDALYEAKVKLFIAAAALPDKLAPTGEHNFAFQRTISRLTEMQSEEYRQKPHLSGD